MPSISGIGYVVIFLSERRCRNSSVVGNDSELQVARFEFRDSGSRGTGDVTVRICLLYGCGNSYTYIFVVEYESFHGSRWHECGAGRFGVFQHRGAFFAGQMALTCCSDKMENAKANKNNMVVGLTMAVLVLY